MKSRKLLVIDNYDSFTYNLVQMFRCYRLIIEVHRNDKITLTEIQDFHPDYLLISPGPRDPAGAGISMDVISHFHASRPILGVCLGMQCLNECFQGTTVRAELPVHGKTSLVQHTGQGLFAGLPSPFRAARYHSLQVRPGPVSKLQVTAWNEDHMVMGLALPGYPVYGVQFHPESFMTESGSRLVENFLRSDLPLANLTYN